MRTSKEGKDRSSNVHARTRHKATCTCVRANLCVCSCGVEHPFFARQRTRTVQLARSAAPNPSLSVQPHCTLESGLSAPLGGGRWKAEVSSHSSLCVRVDSRTSMLRCTARAMHTNVHAPHVSVQLCVRVALWSPFFVRWKNTDCSTGEATSAAPLQPQGPVSSRVATVPPPPVPPARPPTSPCWVGRP